MTEAQLHWLVGWLEGEGCFYLKRTNYPIIEAASTDLDVLVRAGVLMDTQPPSTQGVPKPGHKQAWGIFLGGERAIDVMKQILPYMGERRSKKIAEVIQNAKTCPARKRVAKPGMAQFVRI